MKKIMRKIFLGVVVAILLLMPSTAHAAGAYIKNFSAYNGETVDGKVFTVMYDSEDHGIRYQCISQSIYSTSNQSQYSKTTCVVRDQSGRVLDSSEYRVVTKDYVSVYLLQPAAGTYTIDVESTWIFTNYDVTRTSTFILVIQRADLASLISVSPYSATYDGNEHAALNVTKCSSFAEDQYEVEFSTNGGGTYSKEIPLISAVGNYPVMVRVTGNNDNFIDNEFIQEVAANISARKVTIVPDISSKVYGEADPILTYQAAGELASEPVAGVVLRREPGEEIGSYSITVNVRENLNPNYEISTRTSELNIVPIPMTVMVSDIEACFEEGCDYRLEFRVVDYMDTDITDSVRIQYSIDNGEYCENVPVFSEPGNHVVAYIVEKEQHETKTGKVNVSIDSHNIVVEPAVGATCTTEGKTEGQYCSVCQTVFVASKVIEATGHPNATTYPEELATCTETGLSEGVYCVDCDTWIVERMVLAKVDHIEVNGVESMPTCTESGWTGGSYCQLCKVEFKERQEIPALGHYHLDEPAVAATCTTEGRTRGEYCKFCNEVFVEVQVIPALGHSVVVLDAVVPTCTAGGLTEGSMCSTCGTVLIPQDFLPAVPHTEEIIPSVEATCTAKGWSEGCYCLVCRTVLKEQVELPILPHNKVRIPAVEPTCTDEGYTEGVKCSGCQYVFEKPTIIPASHIKKIDKEAMQPTCTEDGWTEQSHCSRCGDTLEISVSIPATGHSSVIDPYVRPTLTSSGWTEGAHCKICKEVLIKQEEIPQIYVDTISLDFGGCVKSSLPYGFVRHDIVREFDPLLCNTDRYGVDVYGYCYNDDATRMISIYRFPSPWEIWKFTDAFENAGIKDVGVKYSKEKIPYVKGTYKAGSIYGGFVGFSTNTARYIIFATSYANDSIEDSAYIAEVLAYNHALEELTISATCENDGSITTMCSICGWIEREDIIPASHFLVEVPAVDPTCTESGLTQGECCSVCGVVTYEQETIAPLGHTEVIDEAVEPSCAEVGWTTGSHCSLCGIVLNAQMEIPKTTEHVFGEKKVVEEPAENKPGVWAQTCSVCGFMKVGAIPATGITQQRIPGDANVDGNVTLDDVVCILQYASGEEVAINTNNANVNDDDKVDIYDALLIMQYDAGWNVMLR